MRTKDFNIHETGSGGDLALVSNDLLIGEVFYNQVYLALFGGNIEANTTNNYEINEDRFDYWGNDLFNKDLPDKQLNSNTERLLKNIVLNTSGRYELLNSVNQDLAFLKKIVDFKVDVIFDSVNKIKILVIFESKSGNEPKTMQIVYDNAKNELIINKTV